MNSKTVLHNPVVNPIIHPSSPDPLHMFDAEVAFAEDRSTGDLLIKNYQHIPDNFISDLKSGKMDSLNKRSGEMELMMSVPVAVIQDIKDKLGFDMMVEPMRRSLHVLRALHLDGFITSTRQI